LVSPITIRLETLTSAVVVDCGTAPTKVVTTNPVTAEPPADAGGCHDTVARALPGAAPTF
jgi:hypothetical protein